MTTSRPFNMSRRQWLTMIGYTVGSGALYQAMTSLGHAAESDFTGPFTLDGQAKQGATVLVLGAGLAGLVSALELRNAGYKVKVLEYLDRPGGRNWSLHGGDTYTEMGGFKQECQFDKDLYINPGPWRIPYHHRALMDYCKRLNVRLEPFVQYNFNAYLHDSNGFGGEPQRFRHIYSDFKGHTSELLAKAVNQADLDLPITTEDKEILLEALRRHGALDGNLTYSQNMLSSASRGYGKEPGGGLNSAPEPSVPLKLDDLLRSGLWRNMDMHTLYEFQQTMFQPVGGMDMIGKAFARELEGLIQFNAKITEIQQSDTGVKVSYQGRDRAGDVMHEEADWCVCTIPLSVLSQIPMQVGAPMQEAINAVPYAPAVKVGAQFKRRFWEDDDAIYGGISYTNLPISQISYPSTDYLKPGKGVLLAAYMFGPSAVEFTSMPPDERVARAIEYGAQIHKQYKEEFDNGISVAWHRVPWTMGCYGMWTETTRKKHYKNLCEIDGRIVLAGEHASYINAWQEGALLSGLDAITRLHKRAIAA